MRVIPYHLINNRFPAAFRRLSWRLTFNYTTATVGVLLAMELFASMLAMLMVVLNAGGITNAMANQLINEVAPQLSPFVTTRPPDRSAIRHWLEEARIAGLRTRTGEPVINADPEALASPRFHLLILDTDQRVLALFQPFAASAPSGAVGAGSIPGFSETVSQALAGEQDPAKLAWRNRSRLTIAAPIRTADGAVGGALVYSLPFGPLANSAMSYLAVLPVSLLLFTIAGGLIGMIAGAVTARGLTRRLNRVATAAAAWSEGRFAQTIDDSSFDELGQLSRQLNRMAIQLGTLIETREKLSIVEERNRLARDLHDSVKQQVFAISMNLGAAQELWKRDPAAARRRLDSAFELARQSQQELTSIIQTLRPMQLEGKGLQQALREYVQQWQQHSNIATSFEVQGSVDLPLRIEEILFRVAQEALSNVARHSGASAVHVALRVQAELAQLDVYDNGRGFDIAKQRPGVGLLSMRERVEAAGGSLQITRDDAGTRLVAQIPTKEASA